MRIKRQVYVLVLSAMCLLTNIVSQAQDVLVLTNLDTLRGIVCYIDSSDRLLIYVEGKDPTHKAQYNTRLVALSDIKAVFPSAPILYEDLHIRNDAKSYGIVLHKPSLSHIEGGGAYLVDNTSLYSASILKPKYYRRADWLQKSLARSNTLSSVVHGLGIGVIATAGIASDVGYLQGLLFAPFAGFYFSGLGKPGQVAWMYTLRPNYWKRHAAYPPQ